MEYVIYTDESEKAGQYFGNFYGGALVRSVDLHNVLDQIALKKASLHLNDEVKWTKITANYLAKYIELMDCFFDLIAEDKVKVRIMFTKNSNVATNLSTQQRRETYHRLYYQFLKHAFGLRFAAGPTGERIGLRINLDQLPANKEQNTQFKAFLLGLNRNSDFKRAGVFLREDKIAEVESRRSNRITTACFNASMSSSVRWHSGSTTSIWRSQPDNHVAERKRSRKRPFTSTSIRGFV